MSMAMRFFSSAGFCRSQSTLGTMPNIAPPSSRKTPSLKIRTSNRPMRMDQPMTNDADRVQPTAAVWAAVAIADLRATDGTHDPARAPVDPFEGLTRM